ncbi:MAG: FAD:protein FMN transferase [Lacunisphaera sp.]
MTIARPPSHQNPPRVEDRASHSEESLRTLAFRALGTDCIIRYLAPTNQAAECYEQASRGWVEMFEARYSRFRPQTIVSRINQSAGVAWVEVDAEMEQMLDLCGTLHHLTEGILDVTTGPLLRLWDYQQPAVSLPTAAQVAEARKLVGWGKVQREAGRIFLPNAGMALDFGGWGKEWAVDAVAQLAAKFGIQTVLVDFGHDVRCIGAPPSRPAWHVGLEDPAQPGSIRGSVALFAGKGIASSGDYLRGFTRNGRRYGHIVDPRTGEPVAHDCRQVTVIADSCFQAGILSTTGFVLGPTAGLEFIQRFPGAEGLFVTPTCRAQTRGFWNYVAS